jgi:hypothetical protein
VTLHEAGDGGFQFFSLPGGRKSYFRTAPFRTLAGRRRTTVQTGEAIKYAIHTAIHINFAYDVLPMTLL